MQIADVPIDEILNTSLNALDSDNLVTVSRKIRELSDCLVSDTADTKFRDMSLAYLIFTFGCLAAGKDVKP